MRHPTGNGVPQGLSRQADLPRARGHEGGGDHGELQAAHARRGIADEARTGRQDPGVARRGHPDLHAVRIRRGEGLARSPRVLARRHARCEVGPSRRGSRSRERLRSARVDRDRCACRTGRRVRGRDLVARAPGNAHLDELDAQLRARTGSTLDLTGKAQSIQGLRARLEAKPAFSAQKVKAYWALGKRGLD